jgi:O-antigen ligase
MKSLDFRLIRPTTWLPGTLLEVLLVSSVVIAFVSAATYWDVAPFQILAAILLVAAALVVVAKFPLVLVGALLFVGVLKTKPAQGVSLSDPTFIALALTTATILVRFLSVSTTQPVPIRQLLAGQGGGLALYLLFLSIVTGSYLFLAPSTSYGMDKVLRMWSINLVLFFSPLLLLRNEKDLRTLMKVFLVLTFVLAAVTVAGVVAPGEQDRGEARTRIGEAWYIGAAILIFLYHRFNGRFGKAAAVVGIPLLTMAFAASLARGPLLSFLVVLLLSLVVVRSTSAQVSKKMICFGVLTTLLVGAGVLHLIQHLPSVARTFSHKEAELEAFALSENPGGTAGMRLAYYKAAVEGFKEKPFVGWGTGAWPLYYWHEDKRTYPHNIFLETAFEQGLLGLLPFLAFLGAVFKRLFRFLGRQDGRFTFLFPVVLFCLTVTCFSGDITAKELWFWLGTVFAAARMAQNSMANNDGYGRLLSVRDFSPHSLPGR